jgi:predicted extracellular nuclease
MPVTANRELPGVCSGIFFSEYIEGSSYNKALEIYNGSGSAVNLSNFEIFVSRNGASTTSTIALSGTLLDGDVFVVAHTSAGATILAQADETSGSLNFNGDDALVLRSAGGGATLDVIGEVGFDPGSQWGSGDTSTQDNTMRRKSSISSGESNESDAFDPSVEWDGFPNDTFDGLGAHTSDCGGDAAPSVSNTTPSDGVTNVGVDADITLEFSEEVNVTGNWYDISCTTSGTHSATVSGTSPTDTFTLNPDSDFTASESCTVTITASLVSDDDSEEPPSPLASDYSWTFTIASAGGGACSDLFFSEYIEGSSNNKALEIYNGSGSPINLSNYDILVSRNGGSTTSTIALSGTLSAGDVFVVAHTSAGATILAQADETSGSLNFNGDDALVLRSAGGGATLDVIGEVGFDPGSEWGSGETSTQDNTMRRKSSISSGESNESDAFDPSVEWDGFANDTFDGLGAHTSDCGDAAPSLSNTTPSSGGTDVGVNADITIEFSEEVNVTGNWYDISCTTSGTHSATVSGTSPTDTLTLNPDSDFTAGESCTVTITASLVSDDDSEDPPDTLASDYSWTFTIASGGFGTCGDDTETLIHAIQGNSDTSPMNGSTNVVIEGVVVGDFQDTSTQLSGFFVQEEDADADADATTSEGIFVYDPALTTNLNVDDVVRVQGDVFEFETSSSSGLFLTELTSIDAVTVCSSGETVTPATVNLPLADVADWEDYEGMLINIPQTLYVTEHFRLGQYGQVTLSQGGRLSQPTNVTTAGAAANALQADNEKRKIILDDASSVLYPDPILYPTAELSASNTLRGGDTLPNLTGVLDQRFDEYRIQPTGLINFTAANPRPATPSTVEGTLKLASFNVLNYFTTLDDSGNICGPFGNQGCRGADSATEFTRQHDKIISALAAIDADIVGLMEMENNATTAIQNLVTGLNAAVGAGTYDYINTGTLGNDAIKVAMIYKASTVTPFGSAVTTDTFPFDEKNRQPLVQTFEQNSNNERVTIIVNHFKSKGCSGATGANSEQGDGQACWNERRTQAADFLVNSWLPTDPTGSGDSDFLIMGDLNAYAMEEPITTISEAGYTNLIELFDGASAYSFVFDGQWGYLDHALASESLTLQVTGATEWHINADEPLALGYNEENKSAAQLNSLYNSEQYRASDHDPVVIGLDLRTADYSDLGSSYGTAWHSAPNSVYLGSAVDTDQSAGDGSDDDSDDGVVRQIWLSTTGGVDVTVNGGDGYVTGWIDWNQDGDFEDADEQVFSNELVTNGNTRTISFSTPLDASNQTFNVRCRLYEREQTLAYGHSTTLMAAASPTGGASGGEVEDNQWSFGPLAITLADFAAQANGNHILVTWQTVSELSNLGFNLWRSSSPTAPTERLTEELIPSQAPGSGQGFAYSFQDHDVEPAPTYYYWLEDVDTNGSQTLHGPISTIMTETTTTTTTHVSLNRLKTARESLDPLLFGLLGLLIVVAFAVLLRQREKAA